MTEVAFHTGLADKLAYACRLLRKAYRQGARVQVRGDADQLARLDPLLWTFEQLEFVPHLRLRAGQKIDPKLARTPIWLVDEAAANAPEASVLVNLGPLPADDAARFERVVELVGVDADERHAGRLRWRYYESLGLKPVHINPTTT
jgi:DNA polymerase-3 subunit chi